MCEANAFLLKDGIEEMVLDNVDQVDVDGDEIRLVNIFGEQKILKAKIKRYNNSEGKFILEEV
ncbi:MAG: CooT family nickel-binding protein [Deltaproteobacteria bacterium]|nr:CooT family nickel-binding protein [Deltaproteobacteria bacterium]MBW1941640.1 CooT family nickel-binding protein [Deltaproteobacteria bacterium]MBW2205597.1 CooT family nickel-binding protein [Deltaproteobacteria bacterium]